MAVVNYIQIKRSTTAVAPTSLKNGEMAFAEGGNTLFYGKGDGGGGAALSIIPIAGSGSFVDLVNDQVINGDKTFSGEVNANITGTAGAALVLLNARNLSLTGDGSATLAGFNGADNVSAALTLATVNSNVGTFAGLTVNAKGLVTAAAQASLSAFSAPTTDTSAGGFRIIDLESPVDPSDAVNKAYVDSLPSTASTVSGTADRITVVQTGSDYAVNIAATYAGQASITTLGTITTGVWNGTEIAATFGGTGQTSYTTGAILFATSPTTLTQLAAGAEGNFIAYNAAGIPSVSNTIDGGVY